MSLKQSIVIVSEFTFKTKSGGGSRGATPGAYAYDYMARGDAVEPLTPVKLHAQDGLNTLYDAREEAVSSFDSISDVKSAFRESQQSAGVAFGYGYTSLPHDKLVSACDDIQKQFDDGKTVFKTVLSFDEEYLKRLGIVQEDFEHAKKGDYRGQVDQMKLRLAIMSGLDKLSERGFDDLQYVGALQVDTHHVHCHLAMVDRGEGRVINSKTGAQKGKLSKDDFDVVRKGIDSYLNQHVLTKHMSPSVYSDARNVQCYVKNYTHDLMRERALPQFLIACLPEDKNLWRASNRSPAMRKPNAIVREYVQSVLSRPGSGYQAALENLNQRLDRQREQFNISEDRYQELYRSGQNGIIEDCMNGVYQAIKTIPEKELNTRTAMLSSMSMDFESMAVLQSDTKSDPMTEFGFKLRSYAGRQDFHRKEALKYHDAVQSYESQDNIAPAAMNVIDFMRFEEQYHEMLLAKYQHFMTFLPSEEDYLEDVQRLREQRDRLNRYEAMRQDERMLRLNAIDAEKYGREHYQLSGGGLRVSDTTAFELYGDRMRSEFEKTGRELDFNLSMYGLGLFESEDGKQILVQKSIKYPFDDVKALDLHHLQFDFRYDAEISKPNMDAFLRITNQRVELFNKACDYLTRSGQAANIAQFAVRDIQKMSDMAQTVLEAGRLPSAIESYKKSAEFVPRNKMTTSLDIDYNDIMSGAVQNRINYQADGGDI